MSSQEEKDQEWLAEQEGALNCPSCGYVFVPEGTDDKKGEIKNG